MANTGLIEDLPKSLEKAVAQNVKPGETVLVKICGAAKEALICTDSRVLIIKTGLMTGHLFGSNVFQLNYSNIASAEVKYKLLTGYFEISAGGVQNSNMSYWSQDDATNPAKAPNCVSLTGKEMANSFREASQLIMQKIAEAKAPPPAHATSNAASPETSSSSSDLVSQLEQLAKLKEAGVLSQEEFDAAKRKLIAG
ncbi:hypothetical protein MSKU15_1285 [Komagataeibacter diospyri]|uniref:SHOCT domain-containing protein n=1 Tax=Komagataeibacter diospyri TaxID=1932662 RepID=UPI00113D97FA|nr:SHOCT domain-containing protein [Komagataeibacter diospyri]GCE89684.1 hypothetical protein MSKU15_1285 [Komagataeibacter diospyri]